MQIHADETTLVSNSTSSIIFNIVNPNFSNFTKIVIFHYRFNFTSLMTNYAENLFVYLFMYLFLFIKILCVVCLPYHNY
jgi:hypothetical protein